MDFDSPLHTGRGSRSIVPKLTFNKPTNPANKNGKRLSLFLFVFRIFADDHDRAFATDDLAFFTNRLYRRPYFHRGDPSFSTSVIRHFVCRDTTCASRKRTNQAFDFDFWIRLPHRDPCASQVYLLEPVCDAATCKIVG